MQQDKTLPATLLIVPFSAFSSFLTFSIARIDSGMPGRELGGVVYCLRWKKWALCELLATESFEHYSDMKEIKQSDVDEGKTGDFFLYMRGRGLCGMLFCCGILV